MNARFIKSAARAADFPDDVGVEIAVVGRSNSGKSSAINRIVGSAKLARVSKTPGRTQLINFFALGGDDRRLVDLPGYGFARVPDHVRRDWEKLVAAYFSSRRSLAGLLITVDVRRGVMEPDNAMIAWARDIGVPTALLLTKADKLSRGAAASDRLKIVRGLPDAVDALLFSARDGTGVGDARRRIDAWLASRG